MATRFYFPSTGAAAISPAQSASWAAFPGGIRRRLVVTRIGSAASTGHTFLDDAATRINFCNGQWISDPLAAQTIAGTFKSRMRAIQSATAGDFKSQVIIRVLSNDGTAVRGTLYAGDATDTLTSEWATTATSRSFPRLALSPVTVSSVAAQANDRLCIEMGVRITNTTPTGTTGEIKSGDNSSTDLPEDETTTAADNPWIEFSADIAFSSYVTSPRSRARTRQGELLQL